MKRYASFNRRREVRLRVEEQQRAERQHLLAVGTAIAQAAQQQTDWLRTQQAQADAIALGQYRPH